MLRFNFHWSHRKLSCPRFLHWLIAILGWNITPRSRTATNLTHLACPKIQIKFGRIIDSDYETFLNVINFNKSSITLFTNLFFFKLFIWITWLWISVAFLYKISQTQLFRMLIINILWFHFSFWFSCEIFFLIISAFYSALHAAELPELIALRKLARHPNILHMIESH